VRIHQVLFPLHASVDRYECSQFLLIANMHHDLQPGSRCLRYPAVVTVRLNNAVGLQASPMKPSVAASVCRDERKAYTIGYSCATHS
jgi:hypothetical protein